MRRFALFADRAEAGRRLAKELMRFQAEDTVVLGLPRGGVPVAYEVARALDAPLDVCVVRKIGAPIQPELGIGAVAEEGALYFDRDLMEVVGVSDEELGELVEAKRAEVEERVGRFRQGGAAIDVRGKTVLVVDDGIATGGTARTALQTLRSRGAARLVLAVPVGAAQSLDQLASVADEIVCPYPEEAFWAVSVWYEDFTPTTDEDVVELLLRAHAERHPAETAAAPFDEEVAIPLGDVWLEGRLTIPAAATGIVLFAHGSGSSRHSRRNRYVAGELQREGTATLLFDLLTEEEERIDERTGHLRFNIRFLAARLLAVTDWLRHEPRTKALAIGYFGASTGAAAALVAAAERPDIVRAVVSRGGRPDLAGDALAHVEAPTLLLVGGADIDVLELNVEASRALQVENELEIVPGATHLFEEPGTLEHVARSAARWFASHFEAPELPAAERRVARPMSPS